MNKYYLVVAVILLGIFTLRVYYSGGISTEANSDEFTDIVASVSPLRDYLSQTVDQLLPQPQAALLNGMLLGVQSNLPFAFKKALQNTSTIHIVVVSGQNLTLVSGFVLGMMGYLGRKKTIILALAVSLFYAVLTGLQVPVLRALVMVSLTFLAQLFNRDKEGIWVLFLTAGLMLCYKPEWLFSISFQLSFLATVGVVVVSPEINKLLKYLKLPKLLIQDLSVSIAAQVLTAPVIAANFHQFSLVGILVNSLILWTVPIVMMSGVIVLGVGLINLAWGQLLGLVPGVFLTYFVDVVEFFNQQWGNVAVPDINWVFWLGYYILVFSLVAFLYRIKTDQD